VYVAHYTRSPQRLPALTAQLDNVGLSAFIVTAFDKEQLTDAHTVTVHVLVPRKHLGQPMRATFPVRIPDENVDR